MLLLLLLLLVSEHCRLCAALSPLSTSSSAASTSPLFRSCPPPQGPQDQQHQQQQPHLRGGRQSSPDALACTTSSTTNTSNNQQSNSNNNSNKVNVPALQALGYPTGLCRVLQYGAEKVYAKRYWIIDDSLSMTKKDGHFLLYTPVSNHNSSSSNNKKTANPQAQQQQQQDGDYCYRLEQAPCSRWNELQETVLQHALLAHHLDIPTDFRMLNQPTGHFRIPRTFAHKRSHRHNNNNNDKKNRNHNTHTLADVQHAQKVLGRTQPRGVTPLTERLRAVHKELQQSVLPKLHESQKVAIVLATDGLPTNAADDGLSTPQAKRDFQRALQALPADKVSIVIRLCTDDVDVVSFYHALEQQQQQQPPHNKNHYKNVHVVDDYGAEAARVHAHNPWLTYGLVLHRLREMACCCMHEHHDHDNNENNDEDNHHHHYSVPLLKVLSQRPLQPAEVVEFCSFLFDHHPNKDEWNDMSWEDFRRLVEEQNQSQPDVWNPISAQIEPWVNLEKYVAPTTTTFATA